MKKFTKIACIVIITIITTQSAFAQKNVGINTLTPNPNAVLELVAPDGNQGLLLPRLSTTQRNAPSFLTALGTAENGLIVYDTTERALYWWDGTSWKTFTGAGAAYTAGIGIQILAGEIINSSPDQEITLQGTGATTVTGTYPNFTITTTDNTDDADADPTNEIQTFSFTGNEFLLSGSANTALLSSTTPADGQVLVWSTDHWEAQALAGIDNQNLELLADNTLSIEGGNSVDLSPYLDNTDAQDLSLAGNILSLTNDGTTVDLSSFANTDAQDLSWNGNKIQISNGGDINLSATPPATGEVLTWDNTNSRWDASAIPAPSLTNANIFVGNAGGTATGVPMTGDATIDNAGALTIANNAVTTPKILDGAVTTAKIANNAITTAKILDGTIATVDIANNAVDGTKIDLSGNTDGNIMYYSGTGWVRLATGANDEVLKLAGGVPTWATDNGDTYSAGNGIAIDGSNVISSTIWNISGGDITLVAPANNIAIGGAVDANYKLKVYGRFQSAGVNELSDERWKQNIKTLEGSSLSKVKQLRGVNYDWRISENPERNFPKGKQFGFIAQEVEKVFPLAVDTDSEGYKSVQYSHMTALLVEAMKEQQTIIENQQKQIDNLKAELATNTTNTNQTKSIKAQLEKMQQQIKNMQALLDASNTAGK